MHVLILGSGVIGTTMAYYLARDGHQVTVVDRQPGAALKPAMPTRVKCRRAIPPLGRSRRAAQGHQVDADAPQPAGHQADARPGNVALGPVDAAQLYRVALSREQGPHGASGRVQP